MKNKILKYTKEILLFLIILTVMTNIISLYKSEKLNNEKLNIESFRAINDQVYDLDTNKPVLMHIWATWCPTCKIEASNIEFVSKHFQVITIAVKSGDNKEIAEWMQNHKYTFIVVNDKNGILAKKFKTFAFPTSFIYDKNRDLKFSDVGYTSTLGLYLRMLWSEI